MRIWLWIILLGAGSAATYLILHDSGTTRTSEPAEGTVEIAEQYQDDEDVSPPSGGSAVETILPADSIRPSVNAMNAESPPEEEEEQVDADDVLREDADRRRAIRERLLEARDRLFGSVPRRAFVPPDHMRRQRFLASRPSAQAPSSPPPTTSAPSSPSSSTPSSPSGSAGLGGTFPSLPSSGTAATASTTESTTGGTSTRSSQKTVVSPSPAKSKSQDKQDKDNKEVASLPPPKTEEAPAEKSGAEAIAAAPNPDELIQPGEQAADKRDLTGQEGDTRETWVKAMKIPENFEGLSIHPAVITISTAAAPAGIANTMVPPNESAETPSPVALLGATWKSAFTPSETPTLEILLDCTDSTYEACNPHQVAPEGPTVSDYFYKGGPHKEDMVPDTQETFEIGTVVVGSEKNADGEERIQAEAAFHLLPGTVPGRYQAVLTGRDDRRLTASFEVVKAGDQQPAAVETESSAKKTQTVPGTTGKPAEPK